MLKNRKKSSKLGDVLIFLIAFVFSLSLAVFMTLLTLWLVDWIFFDPNPWQRQRRYYDFIERINWILATVVFVGYMLVFLYSFYRKDIKAWRRRKGL
jgi:hypothetical protein